MSELISNPRPEPGSRSADPSGHAAHGGPDGLHHPSIVVRYDAITGPPDAPDEPGDDDVEDPPVDVEDPPADARPAGAMAGRIRAVLGVLAHGLLALAWACLRAAYRYPRWALIVVASVLILGGIALTRPGNPTPSASIPTENSSASSSAPDKPKEPAEGPKEPAEGPKKGPAPDHPAVASTGAAPAAGTQADHKESGEKGGAPVAAPAPVTVPAPAPKVADAGAAGSKSDEKAPPAITPASAEKETVPAPPPPTNQTGASLLADATAGPVQAPAPAAATPPAAEAPTAPASATPDGSRPDPGLPPIPGSNAKAAPVPTSAVPPPVSLANQPAGPGTAAPARENKAGPGTTPEPAGQPPGGSLPAVAEDVKPAGAAGPANAPPSEKPATEPAGGPQGSIRPPGDTPGPAAPPHSPPSQPAAPAAAPPHADAMPSTPAAPSSAPPAQGPPGSLELPGPAPKADSPTPAPPTRAEPTRAEPGRTEPEPGAEAAHDHQAPGSGPMPSTPTGVKPEAQPAPLEVKPEVGGATGVPELPPAGPNAAGPDRSSPPGPEAPAGPASPDPGPPAGPARPAPGFEAPRLDPVRADRHSAGAAPGPNLPRETGPEPGTGREDRSTGSPEAVNPPATTAPPEVTAPPAAAGPTPHDESVAIPTRSGEPPASSPATGPAASEAPGAMGRDQIGDSQSGPSTNEPPDPAARPAQDAAEGGWVAIPNKGRIPIELGGDPGADGRRVAASPPVRRPALDASPGFEPGSTTDAKDRAGVGASAPAAGPGAAVRNARPARGAVEPSLHIVERGENFWTISRLYYGSGRYYRALWRANSRKYPNIDEIHINDVIQIPAVEDLDPAYIERPNRRPIAGREEGPARDLADGSDAAATAGAGRPESFPTTRTARASGGDDGGDDGLTARRAGAGTGRAAAELALPVGDPDPDPGFARGGRAAPTDRSDPGDDAGPATAVRSITLPRRSAPTDRPAYKVQPYDTLRSIARDLLGDARRADELYDLNRDVIDDPTRLRPGQLLELPEDANTRRITARDRSRGRD